MCGIVGYTGRKQAYPVLIKGLKKLENRGYDSAGVALHTGNHLAVYKKQGMVEALEAFAGDSPVRSTNGIGHTRWATTGETSDRNAPPPLSQLGQIAMIQNTIITNNEKTK